MANLMIIEDELLISEDIKDICEIAHHTIVSTCYTSGQALISLKNKRPDLVLLDINLEGEVDGIELAQYIDQQYGIPYIFITSFSDEETLSKIKKCHSVGYIVKPFSQEQLLSSITLGLNTSTSQGSFGNTLRSKSVSLTDREIEILKLLILGHNREQIAQNIYLSINTVKYHMKSLYKKVGITSQVELIRWWNE